MRCNRSVTGIATIEEGKGKGWPTTEPAVSNLTLCEGSYGYINANLVRHESLQMNLLPQQIPIESHISSASNNLTSTTA